jgi:hypothetical protein
VIVVEVITSVGSGVVGESMSHKALAGEPKVMDRRHKISVKVCTKAK